MKKVKITKGFKLVRILIGLCLLIGAGTLVEYVFGRSTKMAWTTASCIVALSISVIVITLDVQKMKNRK